MPAGITLAEARERVESSWSWPARRLLFFASDGAWIWDEAQPLFGGSWIVGRAPWPVTVVLRLLSANAKTVSHPVPVCIPAGVLATAKGARVALGRNLGMAPELFEQLRFEAGETTPLEDDENLEVAKLKAMICRFRPAAQRMMLELLRMRVLWTMGKKGQRPPPQEAWLAPISEGGAPCECLRTLQAAVQRVESEAGDLIFNATEDAYRWRVELKKPAQADWIEMLCTFPAGYPAEPVRLEGSFQMDGREVEISSLGPENWSPQNTVYCALGEVVDFIMLYTARSEARIPGPRIPRLPLS